MIFHNKYLSTLLFVSINSIHLTLAGLWQLYGYLNVITKELSRDLLATVNCLVAVSTTSLGRNPNRVTINYLSAKILGLRLRMSQRMERGFLYGSSNSSSMSLHVFFYSIQYKHLELEVTFIRVLSNLHWKIELFSWLSLLWLILVPKKVFSVTVLKNIINDQ